MEACLTPSAMRAQPSSWDLGRCQHLEQLQYEEIFVPCQSFPEQVNLPFLPAVAHCRLTLDGSLAAM